MTNQELIKIAKQKYHPGTIFSNVNLGFECKNIEVIGTEFKEYSNDIKIEVGFAIPKFSSYTVYCKKLKKWAEILSKPIKIYELW
jgi:hypothetical protein